MDQILSALFCDFGHHATPLRLTHYLAFEDGGIQARLEWGDDTLCLAWNLSNDPKPQPTRDERLQQFLQRSDEPKPIPIFDWQVRMLHNAGLYVMDGGEALGDENRYFMDFQDFVVEIDIIITTET